MSNLQKTNSEAILDTKNTMASIGRQHWQFGRLHLPTCEGAARLCVFFQPFCCCRKNVVFSKLLQNQNHEKLWRSLKRFVLDSICRCSFLDHNQTKITPRVSAWSSLREGADLEMLLVFEGSDGIIEKWLSRASGRSHWLGHPWNDGNSLVKGGKPLLNKGPTLQFGGGLKPGVSGKFRQNAVLFLIWGIQSILSTIVIVVEKLWV